MSSIAIIPARGGSKRIPRKNIKEFAGRPMISYAISAALKSNLFKRVVVSTEDLEIAEIAKDWGAEVPFSRPPELADDYTPTVPVIAHAIRAVQQQGTVFKYACCIYPGVPFIQAKDLMSAFDLLIESGAGYCFPITEYPSVIQRALRRFHDGRVEPISPQFEWTRTQDLEATYFDAGQFYWGSTTSWLDGLGLQSHGAGLEIPEWRVVDIDTPDDWVRAEIMYRALGVSDE